MIIIEGDTRFVPESEFKPKIQQALDLLQTKSSADHILLTAIVERIVASRATGAVYTDALIRIGRQTFDASITWLASVLVHESFHIAQYLCKKPYVGKVSENECNMIQLLTLRFLNAPQHEITYLLSQKGDHADLNGDGKYDRKDYLLRPY